MTFVLKTGVIIIDLQFCGFSSLALITYIYLDVTTFKINNKNKTKLKKWLFYLQN